ncbi:MAG: hypothetical protein COA79_14785 [Planctomycetota bacterium]|nr:MAG: hypothetical protein COA79_14785 [Planctomycetota bacterium]
MITRTTYLIFFTLLFPLLMGKDKAKIKSFDQIQIEIKNNVKSIYEDDLPVKNKKNAINKYLKVGLKALSQIKKKAIRRRKFDDARAIQAEMRKLKSKKSYWLKKYYALIDQQLKAPLSINGYVLNYNNYWDMTPENRQKTVKKFTIKNKYGLYQFNGKNFNFCSENNDSYSLETALSLEVFEKETSSMTQFVSDLKITIYAIKSRSKLNSFTWDNFKHKMRTPGVYVRNKQAIFLVSSANYFHSTLFHEAAHHLCHNGIQLDIRYPWFGEGLASLFESWLLDCDLETNLYINNFISIRRYPLMKAYYEKKINYTFFQKLYSNPQYSRSIPHSYSYYWSIFQSMYNNKKFFKEVLKKSKSKIVGAGIIIPELDEPLKQKIYENWEKHIKGILVIDNNLLGVLGKAFEHLLYDLPYNNSNRNRTNLSKKQLLSNYYPVRNIERVIQSLKPKIKDRLIYSVIYGLHLFCVKNYKNALIEFLKLEKDYYRLSFLFPLIGKCYQDSGDEVNANIYFDRALRINRNNHLVNKYKTKK